MRTLIGSIILESLADQAPLMGWQPVAQRAVERPEDPDATIWHDTWYQVDEERLRERLPLLAQAMQPHWYAHFWAGDDLCVILAGRFFWVSAVDRSTWNEFIAYGDTVGVERKFTERVSPRVPDWVQAAATWTHRPPGDSPTPHAAPAAGGPGPGKAPR